MEWIRLTLNGHRHELSRAMVEPRLSVEPETIRKHAVRVNGTWYPVRQALEVALGVSRTEFISHAARRHLAALGFEVHGEIDSRNTVPAAVSKGEKGFGSGASSDVDVGKEIACGVQRSGRGRDRPRRCRMEGHLSCEHRHEGVWR